MTDLPLLVGLALGAALVGLFGLDAVIRNRVAGAWVLVGCAGLRAAADGRLPGTQIGSFSVYAGDVVLGLLATACIARLLRGWRLARAHGWLLALGALVAYSLLRGFGLFDFAAVLNEARDTLYFLVVALYFAVDAPADLRERLAKAWIALAGFLLLLAAVRWAALLGGLPYAGDWRDPVAYGGIRVLWSDDTLVLAQSFLLLLPRWLDGTLSATGRRLTVAVGAAVLLLQHRSVWMCLLVGLVALVAQEASFRQRAGFRLAAGVAVTVALAVLVAPGDTRQQERLFSSRAASTGTFSWRVEGWQRLIDQRGPEGPMDAALGLPYGTGYERDLGPYTTDAPPHNYYVELFLRVGLVGVAVLLLIYAWTVARLWTAPRVVSGLFNDRTLVPLLVTQLVYYIPYWPRLEQGLLLGLAIGAASARKGALHLAAQGGERAVERR